MITTEMVYVANCDNCNEQWLDRNDCAGHFEKRDTENGLMESEWHTTDEGKTYCPKCWEMDEEDNIIIKVSAKKED